MKTHLQVSGLAAHRRMAIIALAAIILLTGILGFNGPAWSVELDHPSSVIDTNETKLPIISSPTPVPANDDSCLPLLKSVRQYAPPPSATDWDQRTAGKAAALGLIFGVRFALGPKELAKSRRTEKPVRFDIWQPRDSGNAQAMAVADYRRCKNEQALKAISDWRWAR